MAFSQVVSAHPVKGLKTEVNLMGDQPGLHDQASIQILKTKAWVRVPGWQHSVCIVTHQCQECNAVLDPMKRGHLEAVPYELLL